MGLGKCVGEFAGTGIAPLEQLAIVVMASVGLERQAGRGGVRIEGPVDAVEEGQVEVAADFDSLWESVGRPLSRAYILVA